MSPTVLITGASRGIGLAAAEFILADGAKVIVLQHKTTPAFEALPEKYPGSVQIVGGDFIKASDIVSALALTDSSSLDRVVLNAGVGLPFGTIATIPLSDYRAMFEVNLFTVGQFLQLFPLGLDPRIVPAVYKSY